jgi:hypothetical protein
MLEESLLSDMRGKTMRWQKLSSAHFRNATSNRKKHKSEATTQTKLSAFQFVSLKGEKKKRKAPDRKSKEQRRGRRRR